MRPGLARRAASPDAVLLRPLVPPASAIPLGYIAGFPTQSGDASEPVSVLRWTLQALQVLAPEAFLVAELAIASVYDPSFERLIRDTGRDRLLPALTQARVGRRLAEVTGARRMLQGLGMRVAVAGHRIRRVGEFDALVITPPFAVDSQCSGELLIATGLSSPDHLTQAEARGADFVEGNAVAEPIRVAPVDLKRLRR
jgi:hypothetical protein